MTVVRVTKCSILDRPADPGPESQMRYTIRIHAQDGPSIDVANVASAVQIWQGFDVIPASRVGEENHPEGGWLVLWIGDKWYPFIFHVPASFDCTQPETPR